MNKPQSIEDILESCREQDWAWSGEDEYSTETFNVDKAKASIEAMVRDIIGQDELSLVMSPGIKIGLTGRVDNTWTSEHDTYREAYIKTSLQMQQRLRASKYNLKLEKE